jgi:hypothetical protein
VPTIVAESLQVLDTPPTPLPRSVGVPRAVAARLARSAAAPEAGDPPPGWLLASQHRSFRRLLHTVRRFGGAMLAEPVGTGKTYIALAVAHARDDRATCIVPAALARQWREVALRVGVSAEVSSHERASRGVLPEPRGFVIVDESHHYRNPATRRYSCLARWLIGQEALLLTATPVVNRLEDLTAQLALILPDDALALAGTPSLAMLAQRDSMPASISCVVHAGGNHQSRPRAVHRVVRTPAPRALREQIEALALSRHGAIAALIRGVLLRALASSPAALAASARRYRLLLLQASDAARAGLAPSRAALRRWAGELPEQTVLWELLGEDGGAELSADDLPGIERMIRALDPVLESPDGKAAELAGIVRDGAPTLVFSSSRDTTRWLRRWIDPAPAWCTGDAAGVGHTRMPRSAVLGMFSPAAPCRRMPSVLLATEVAAEGLDLQEARRVVHYDLPWTPARLEQREGRARRLGGRHREVEVIAFEPDAELESSLRQVALLEAKRALGPRARLAGTAFEDWNAAIERALAEIPFAEGIAVVASAPAAGALVGLELHDLGVDAPEGGALVWIPRDGPDTDDIAVLAERLEAAHAAPGPAVRPLEAEYRWLEARTAPIVQRMLGKAHRARLGPTPRLPVRAVVRRVAALGRHAARFRDERTLRMVDRALRSLTRGHTAGEASIIREHGEAPESELMATLSRIPERRTPGQLVVRISAVILFRSTSAPLA